MSFRTVGACVMFALLSAAAPPALAQTPSAQEMQALRHELEQLRAEDRERAARMDAIERRLDEVLGQAGPDAAQSAPDAAGGATADAAAPELPPAARYPAEAGDRYASVAPDQTFGAFSPGRGFTVASTPHASLNISAYGLVRYLNQMPGDDTSFTDHLGREREIDPRNDFQWHRTLIFFTGWMFDPRFRYNITAWAVNSTEQSTLIGTLAWKFNDAFELAAGLGRLPGTSTLMVRILTGMRPTASWRTNSSDPDSPAASGRPASSRRAGAIWSWSATA